MSNSSLLELYGIPVENEDVDWGRLIAEEQCPYTNRQCSKIRKSSPDITIGTCSVRYGRDRKGIMICPNRLLERGQIFLDCIHLLTTHEPGNELHIVPEITIPGGSVDYFLVSVRNQEIRDFVGVELQTLDTTGTIWPARQQFLQDKDVTISIEGIDFNKRFGMNWKMTAKTILVQLNHKIQTFENINKHLVLVLQDHLLAYMQREFQFEHIGSARLGDSMHLHSYTLNQVPEISRLDLTARYSTDANGIAQSLGLQTDPNVSLEQIITLLASRISPETIFRIL